MIPPPPRSTLFPYTTLFRSDVAPRRHRQTVTPPRPHDPLGQRRMIDLLDEEKLAAAGANDHPHPDRKSTRLNSSHSQISYAVFCLKKKKNTNQNRNVYRKRR